jgi:uncharacterized UBP type Zn finger protein
MSSKCIYCCSEISPDRTMQICDNCGIKVWGEKMFKAILNSTETEKEKGNMELGRVSETPIQGIQKSMSNEINANELN